MRLANNFGTMISGHNYAIVLFTDDQTNKFQGKKPEFFSDKYTLCNFRIAIFLSASLQMSYANSVITFPSKIAVDSVVSAVCALESLEIRREKA